MSESLFFIVNARIGMQKIKQCNEAIQKYFPDSVKNIHVTEYAGHAKKLCNEALENINEVIQLLAHTDIKLGIVPTGSGNGLARHLGISLHIDEAIAMLVDAKSEQIDLGKANEFYFVSNAGVGFDAVICNAIKQSKYRGLKMYVVEVMKQYVRFKASDYVVEVDGKTFRQKAFFLNVANGSEFGYGFRMAPSANLQDGMLDMVMIQKINFINGFSIVLDGFRRKMERNKHCLHISGKQISISSQTIPYFQTDGDAHDNTTNHCLISIQPKALHILLPTQKIY
jgi:diacylglycerol kinase (ATP)